MAKKSTLISDDFNEENQFKTLETTVNDHASKLKDIERPEYFSRLLSKTLSESNSAREQVMNLITASMKNDNKFRINIKELIADSIENDKKVETRITSLVKGVYNSSLKVFKQDIWNFLKSIALLAIGAVITWFLKR